jgi:hypothetical protein
MAIKRVWHGWTTREDAGRYQELLHNEVLPGIEAKGIGGYRKIEVLRIDRAEEVEFVTIMTFDALQNVIEFQGEDYRKCYVPEAARKLLARWDQESTHYELVETREYRDGKP